MWLARDLKGRRQKGIFCLAFSSEARNGKKSIL
jgi:hypothetical protein